MRGPDDPIEYEEYSPGVADIARCAEDLVTQDNLFEYLRALGHRGGGWLGPDTLTGHLHLALADGAHDVVAWLTSEQVAQMVGTPPPYPDGARMLATNSWYKTLGDQARLLRRLTSPEEFDRCRKYKLPPLDPFNYDGADDDLAEDTEWAGALLSRETHAHLVRTGLTATATYANWLRNMCEAYARSPSE